MKEVKEWNGKPRLMWCWDNSERNKYKGYVVRILTEEEMKEAETNYSVIIIGNCYKHCAEIEEMTRLTCYELSQLLKCFGVEFCYKRGENCSYFAYTDDSSNEKLSEDYKIRYKQGELEEPTRETVLKWCKENPDSDISRFVSFIGWDKE